MGIKVNIIIYNLITLYMYYKVERIHSIYEPSLCYTYITYVINYTYIYIYIYFFKHSITYILIVLHNKNIYI